MLGDTHSETGGPARLPAQVAGLWGHKNLNRVRWWKKYFVYWADQSSQGRIKSLVSSLRAQRTNQGRTDHFYLYTSNPHSSQFQSASRGNPSPVSLDMLAIAMQCSRMHIVRSHARCTVLYVHETRAPGYAEKTHCWEKLGEDFFYEESILRSNWEQRKGFHSMKNHYIGKELGAEEEFPILWRIIIGKELGAVEGFSLL